ncbi:MAG: DUF4835 family protein [Bacteroidetes bacterium]|nr:DUF4835 family protein [Bacteroidota bacterium]
MRKFIILLFLFSFATLNAQELNCKVQVLSQGVQGTDKRAFESMQTAIYEFLNNRKWTNDTYKNIERIDCSILINITERSGDDFKGTLQIQSRRPVYKSSFNSVLLNYNDNDIQFKYLESQPFDFNDNSYLSELTSLLGYYAYLIIGLDYDSFSLNGGTPYLQKALAVVNNAQNSSSKGWKAFDDNKNRYWHINNMLDASFIPLRECMYNYHRKGLDIMSDNKEAGRAVILESIESIKKVHQIKPLSFSTQVFFNAKSDEIINIFSGAFADEKSKIVNILNEIDPTNSNKYQKIIQQ